MTVYSSTYTLSCFSSDATTSPFVGGGGNNGFPTQNFSFFISLTLVFPVYYSPNVLSDTPQHCKEQHHRYDCD